MRVFTNGCFDLFHVGHLQTIEYAEWLAGDDGQVWVGINSDESVRRLKGDDRPIIRQWERLRIVSNLYMVYGVHIFDEDTPYELIKRVKPDIIVKGPEYAGLEDTVVGADIAEVRIVPKEYHAEGVSTSAIIEKIKNGP